ncbi:hypothetical protein PQS31_06110 [Luteimonas sp BLCC-B24]|uniref:hypothetical protein n=1 Tax=Luteimonas sp. BLCC-B24 TaxID=3025317 RepID=UPI00234DD946|nr:hypothetical protein [Luteimonas sp. BLCC-B24]MDC7806397.1 hypothetical protein [Luteimonas sp. BLCC-B24]
MSTLTDTIRAHYIASVDAGRFDGDGLDALLAEVEALQLRALAHATIEPATQSNDGYLPPAVFGIQTGNADLVETEHNAHVRAMQAREAVLRG